MSSGFIEQVAAQAREKRDAIDGDDKMPKPKTKKVKRSVEGMACNEINEIALKLVKNYLTEKEQFEYSFVEESDSDSGRDDCESIVDDDDLRDFIRAVAKTPLCGEDTYELFVLRLERKIESGSFHGRFSDMLPRVISCAKMDDSLHRLLENFVGEADARMNVSKDMSEFDFDDFGAFREFDEKSQRVLCWRVYNLLIAFFNLGVKEISQMYSLRQRNLERNVDALRLCLLRETWPPGERDQPIIDPVFVTEEAAAVTRKMIWYNVLSAVFKNGAIIDNNCGPAQFVREHLDNLNGEVAEA